MGTVDPTFSSSSPEGRATLGWDNPAADPTTTILLLAIVVLLNLTAIVVRNRLRRKYQTSAF